MSHNLARHIILYINFDSQKLADTVCVYCANVFIIAAVLSCLVPILLTILGIEYSLLMINKAIHCYSSKYRLQA